jgi:hypothetical protein
MILRAYVLCIYYPHAQLCTYLLCNCLPGLAYFVHLTFKVDILLCADAVRTPACKHSIPTHPVGMSAGLKVGLEASMHKGMWVGMNVDTNVGMNVGNTVGTDRDVLGTVGHPITVISGRTA